MYRLEEMTDAYADEINSWKYPAPYEMYSFAGDEAELEQICCGYYFAVVEVKTGKLAGFFCLGPAAQKICDENQDIFDDESYTDIAFGLRPELTGKGFGQAFVEGCIRGAKEFFPEDGIRLCVRKDNQRAMHLYEKMGFVPIFENETFQVMILQEGEDCA